MSIITTPIILSQIIENKYQGNEIHFSALSLYSQTKCKMLPNWSNRDWSRYPLLQCQPYKPLSHLGRYTPIQILDPFCYMNMYYCYLIIRNNYVEMSKIYIIIQILLFAITKEHFSIYTQRYPCKQQGKNKSTKICQGRKEVDKIH